MNRTCTGCGNTFETLEVNPSGTTEETPMSRRRTPPHRKPRCPNLWGSHGCKKAIGHSGDCICTCGSPLALALSYGAKVFT